MSDQHQFDTTAASDLDPASAALPSAVAPSSITLSFREHATVLAALRYWQRLALHNVWAEDHPELEYLAGQAVVAEGEISTASGDVRPLSVEEIDTLCERINQ